MKQILVTACEEGRSVSGSSGYQVRAASKGVSSESRRAAMKYANYKLPVGMDGQTPVEKAPVQLALLESPDVGRILVHGVHAGLDPVTKREGNYFSHLLLEVPPGIGPMKAVCSLGSRFWLWRDGPGISTELPDAKDAELSDGGLLSDAKLAAALADRKKAELLRFLLHAVLTTDRKTKIFLVAPHLDVALCIYGLLRGLPEKMLDALTFSTAEAEPLTCWAQVIGVSYLPGDSRDLPAGCFSGGSVAFDPRRNTKSLDLPPEPAIVGVILKYFERKQFAELDEFRSAATRLGLTDPGKLDLLHRLLSGTSINRPDIEQALALPALGDLIAVEPAVQDAVVSFALADGRFVKEQLPLFVQACRRTKTDLKRLARVVYEEGKRSLTAPPPKVGVAKHALEVVLPVLADRPDDYWAELLRSVHRPETLSRDARLYLLPYAFAGGKKPPRANAWLQVELEDLPTVLGMRLDADSRKQAAQYCITNAKRLGPVGEVLAGYPDILLELAGAQPEQRALELFGAAFARDNAVAGLLSRDPNRLLDLLRTPHAVALFEVALPHLAKRDVLDRINGWAKELKPEVRDACLASLFENGAADPAWAEARGPALLNELPDGKCLPVLVAQALRGSAAPSKGLIQFLKNAFASKQVCAGLSLETRGRLDALLLIDTFLVKTRLEKDDLGETFLVRLADVLRRDGRQSEQVLAKVASALLDSTAEAAQGNLSAVLKALGAVFGDRDILYRRLVKDYQKDDKLVAQGQAGILCAMLSVAFANRVQNQPRQPAPTLENEGAEILSAALAKRPPVFVELVRLKETDFLQRLLGNEKAKKAITALLGKQPGLLQSLAKETRGFEYFRLLLPHLSKKKVLEEVGGWIGTIPKFATVDDCLAELIQNGEGDAKWLETHGPALLRQAGGGRSLALLVDRVMANPKFAPSKGLTAFLLSLLSSREAWDRLSKETRNQLNRLFLVEDFVSKPSLTATDLGQESLSRLVPVCATDDQKDRVLKKVADAVWEQQSQTHLETMLLVLGDLAGGPPKLYRWLVDYYQAQKVLFEPNGIASLLKLLAVGFAEEFRVKQSLRDLRGTQGDAARVVHALGRLKTPKVREAVERHVETKWTNEAAIRAFHQALESGSKPREWGFGIGRFWIGFKDVLLFVMVLALAVVLFGGLFR